MSELEQEQEKANLEKTIALLKNKIASQEVLLSLYEVDGSRNLFYALNRKSNEMALLLNKYNLTDMDLSASNKEFERLKGIWDNSTNLATALKSLEQTSGVIGDKEKDLQPRFRISPESIADEVGELAGKKQ